jgi:predicted  nucleic acid-binding Zn-ribbon protein
VESLKQDLELLYELQIYDIKIDDVRKKVDQAPLLIEEKNEVLFVKKAVVDATRQHFVEMSSLKKEKEALLDSKEKAINKYVLELNTVKSNNVYKALLLEIEKSKADKTVVEDEILELMDRIDGEAVKVKVSEDELKMIENKIKNDIREIELSAKKLEEEIIKIEKEREDHKLKIDKSVLLHYERLRKGRSGQGIALIDQDSCSGCGMALRPQLINQAQKGLDLVFCDNCSRILLKK